MTPRHSAARPASRRGFTLVELLVAMAILLVVLSGILAVFLGSMKAIRQGYRHMDAYEMTRGTSQVINRDLTGGFTSRDHGDYYNFFGTPYGMTFVGLAANFQGIGQNDNPNVSRVSYVVRQIGQMRDPQNGQPVVDGAGLPVPDPLDRVDSENGVIHTFVLIRYVEHNRDDLEAFRNVDWTGQIYLSGLDPVEFPDIAQQVANLQAEFAAVNQYVADNNLTNEVHEKLVSAKKRELWLRMLRGNGPVPQPDGTMAPLPANQQLPDYFALLWSFMDRAVQPADRNEVIKDYIVATNIHFIQYDIEQANLYQSYIEANLASTTSDPRPVPMFGTMAFDYGLPLAATTAPDGSPIPPNIFLAQDVLRLAQVRQHGRFVVTYLPFWNAFPDNVQLAPRLASEYPGLPALFTSYGAEGSPLLPRLPASVHVKLRFFFPAPNVAAAEVNRVLDQTIDIPTAFTRPQVGIG